VVGTVDFKHDVHNDVVIAIPRWHMETEEDCRIGFGQCDEYFRQFNRKMDVIFVFDYFTMSCQVMSSWGEYRARMIESYIRFSCRVNPELLVRIASMISNAKYKTPNRETNSIEEAIAAIKAERAKAGIQ
jgi:hypothetical protein